MTRPWQERIYNQLSKGKIGKTGGSGNILEKSHCRSGDCRQERFMKLTQAHNVLTKTVHATLHKDL
jgi:hypothetical protein